VALDAAPFAPTAPLEVCVLGAGVIEGGVAGDGVAGVRCATVAVVFA